MGDKKKKTSLTDLIKSTPIVSNVEVVPPTDYAEYVRERELLVQQHQHPTSSEISARGDLVIHGRDVGEVLRVTPNGSVWVGRRYMATRWEIYEGLRRIFQNVSVQEQKDLDEFRWTTAVPERKER